MSQFRADRFASLYFFHPLQRLCAQGAKIPILMYHGISDSDESAVHPYYRTNTTLTMFEQQVRYLHQNGYRTVSVTEVFSSLQTAASVEKLVGITFDDGYQNFYTNAFPILNQYRYSATVFLPTAYIGQVSRQFNGSDCLTWNQVRELRKAGVEFGSHTVTHPQLREMGLEQLREEITLSKEHIEEKLGESVATFSYPYAFPETDRGFVDRLRGLLQEAGYREGVSTIVGRTGKSDGRLFMKRLPVNSCDDVALLEAKLAGGYDWLRGPQRMSKMLKTYLQNA